jgi:hypothetical protein
MLGVSTHFSRVSRPSLGAKHKQHWNYHKNRKIAHTQTKKPLCNMTTFNLLALVCLIFAAQWCKSTAFSFPIASSLARPASFGRIPVPFLGRKTRKQVAVEPTPGKQSLDEFNAMCQQLIAEERREHYYPYLATSCQTIRE